MAPDCARESIPRGFHGANDGRGTTATLRVTGLADAPRFDFSSSPPLPQDEIMAQLLFGENAAQLTALKPHKSAPRWPR